MKATLVALALIAVVASAAILAGCETESASSDPTISPSSAILEEGESVTFTASGGYDYTWSLENETWGTLSAKTGSQTTYTSRYSGGTNSTAIQTLTLTSTIEGSATGTNGTGYQRTAEAYITHLGTEDDSETLVVTPSSATVSNGQSKAFTVSGGDGTYSWDLGNEQWGTLDTRTGSQATYTSAFTPTTTTNTIQTITVTSGGSTASAYVKHQANPLLSALTISPTAASLTNGQSTTFTASQGSGTYAWSISDSSLGLLSSAVGANTTYYATNTSIGTDVQTLTVESGDESLSISIIQTTD